MKPNPWITLAIATPRGLVLLLSNKKGLVLLLSNKKRKGARSFKLMEFAERLATLFEKTGANFCLLGARMGYDHDMIVEKEMR